MNAIAALASLVGGVALVVMAGRRGSVNCFRGIRQAHEHYGFPGSYQRGAIVHDGVVVRAYANGEYGDLEKEGGDVVYYGLKSDAIRPALRQNKRRGTPLRFFIRRQGGVEDMGRYEVDRFYAGKVKLLRVGS